MTYDNLALALIQESTYNIDNEIDNFSKICESINILNENNILLEEDKVKTTLKERLIKIWDKIKEKIQWLKDKILSFINKIKEFVSKKKKVKDEEDEFLELTLLNDITTMNPDNIAKYANEIIDKMNQLYDYMSQVIYDANFDNVNKFNEIYDSIDFNGEPKPEEYIHKKDEKVDPILDRIENQMADFQIGINKLEKNIKIDMENLEKVKNLEVPAAVIGKFINVENYAVKLFTDIVRICGENINIIWDNA